MLHEYYDGKISLNFQGNKLNFSQLYDKVQPVEQGRIISNERISDTLTLIRARQQQQESDLMNKIEQCNPISNDRIAHTLRLVYQQQLQKQSIKEYQRSSRCLRRKHLDHYNQDKVAA